MTMEEMQQGLKDLQDNMAVQGRMMYRIESNLDRLEAVVAENNGAIARNTEAILHLADGQKSLQSAMAKCFEALDHFIRGQGTNGHE